MKKLLAMIGILAIATPTSLSFTTGNSNFTNINSSEQQATIEEQIVEAIKANLWKITENPNLRLVISQESTVAEFKDALDQSVPILMLIVLPKELRDSFDFYLVHITHITLDGQELSDEILKEEGKKIAEITFDYGSVKNESISLPLVFEFD